MTTILQLRENAGIKTQDLSCSLHHILNKKIQNMSLGRTAKLNTGAEIPLVGLGMLIFNASKT